MSISSKKGSHVGVVLSVLVFITFAVFLYVVMEPALKTQENKKNLLEYLKPELIKKASANLTTVIITPNVDPSTDCLQVDKTALEVDELDSLVKDEDGNIYDLKDYGASLEVAYIGQAFLKLYFSDQDLKDVAEPSCNFYDSVYNVGLATTKQYVFITKIAELMTEYGTNYEVLKTELNIPSNSEFGFSFKYANDTIINTEEKNVSTSVYVKEIPVQYVDWEANINPGFINIRIW